MFAKLSLNIFSISSDRVVTFCDDEDVVCVDKKHGIDVKINAAKQYFKDYVLLFESKFNDSKYSYSINDNAKTMSLSYFNDDNTVEYVADISY